MKFNKLKTGQILEDRWFWDWGLGKVKEIKKTVVKIDFAIKGLVTFDKSHVQFLECMCEEHD